MWPPFWAWRRKLGLHKLLPGFPPRLAKLALAMIVARVIEPAAKLATARQLSEATAAHSLGAVLELGAVDEDELYAALDLLGEAQPEDRDSPGQAPSARRLPGSLRSDIELSRRPALRAWALRLQPRRQKGQAANRLRPAVRRRWLSGCGGGVRRQHGRSVNLGGASHETEGTLRPVPRGARGRSRHDHRGKDRGRPRPRRVSTG